MEVDLIEFWWFLFPLFLEHGHGHSHRRAHHRSLPTIEEVLAEEDINENHENYRLSDNMPNTGQDGHGHRQMGLWFSYVFMHNSVVCRAVFNYKCTNYSLMIWCKKNHHILFITS